MSKALRIDTPSWGASGTQLNGCVNITAYPFGAVGDGVTDNAAALAAAIAESAVLGVPIYVPTGRFRTTANLPNMSHSGGGIVGDPGGGSRIVCEAAGVIASCDGGAIAGAVVKPVFKDIVLEGNVATTIGLFMRACFHGRVEDVRVVNAVDDGFLGVFVSGMVFRNFVISTNEEAYAAKPNFGMRFTRRNAFENSTACLLINCILEGLTTGGDGCGIKLDYVDIFTILGGFSQGNKRGIELTLNGGQTLVISLWMEANSVDDILDDSFFCTFLNIKSETLVHEEENSYNNAYIRGSADNIQIDENVAVADQGILLDHIAIGGALGLGTFTDNGRLTKRKVWSWGGGTFAGSREFAWAPNLGAGAFLSTTEVGLTYVKLGDRVLVSPITAALPDGVEVYATVIADEQVRITAVNHDAAGHNLVGFEWRLDIP